jgi:hypothetical protein
MRRRRGRKTHAAVVEFSGLGHRVEEPPGFFPHLLEGEIRAERAVAAVTVAVMGEVHRTTSSLALLNLDVNVVVIEHLDDGPRSGFVCHGVSPSGQRRRGDGAGNVASMWLVFEERRRTLLVARPVTDAGRIPQDAEFLPSLR